MQISKNETWKTDHFNSLTTASTFEECNEHLKHEDS